MKDLQSRQPDDAIEVADERLTFIADETPGLVARTRRFGKGSRLALATGGTCIALLFLLRLFVMSAPKPDVWRNTADGAAKSREKDDAGRAADGSIAKESSFVLAIATRAQAAGVPVVDAFFDEAIVHYRTGRLREAIDLFGAALVRDPSNELVRGRLEATVSQLARAIDTHVADAERAASQFRFDDAAREWEQVLFLTDAADSRHVRAQVGLDLARTRRN